MATKYWVGGTGTLDGVDTTHISDSSGGAGGAVYPATGDDMIWDASSGGGTVTVTGSPNFKSITMGAFTGTLDFGSSSPTLQTFSNSGTGTRTLVQGSGTWTITGNNTTIWDWTTLTNFTFTKGANPILFTYSGATGTRAIVSSSLAGAGALSAHPDMSITAGTDTVTINNSRVGHLVFTGFSGTLASGIRVIYGNLTISPTMTWATGTSTTTFGGTSGTQLITTNGIALNSPFTVDGVGGAVQLADNFSMDGASLRALTLTAGSLDTNSVAVTCGSYSSNNSNVRSLTLGASVVTLKGTGTVWNNGGANSTCSMADSTIVVSNTSSAAKAMSSGTGNGSGTFGVITLTAGGTGAFTFNANARTINTFNVSGPKNVVFTSGTTTTITNWNVNETNNSPVSITASTPGSAATISVASGTINSYYLSLQDITATGGATFNAINSTDVSGNSGWNFLTSDRTPASRDAASALFVNRDETGSPRLNGSTGYIDFGSSATYLLGTSGAFECEFYLDKNQVDTNTANARFLICIDNGNSTNWVLLAVTNTTTAAITLDVRKAAVSTTLTAAMSPGIGLLDSGWHKVTCRWSAAGSWIVVDAVEVASNASDMTTTLTGTPAMVSGRLGAGFNLRYLTGMVRNFKLMSSATVAEAQASHLYDAPYANQVSGWNCNSIGGTVVPLTFGAGNAGTLTGGVTVVRDTMYKLRSAVNPNMVYNGNFEIVPAFTAATTTIGRWIDGTAAGSTTSDISAWAIEGINSAGTVAAQFDESVFHGGTNSLKVSTIAAAAACSISPVRSVGTASLVRQYAAPCLPSTSYTLTYWMKTQANSGAATTGAYGLFRTYSTVGASITTTNGTKITTTTDWTQYTVTVTTDANAAYIVLIFRVVGNDGAGTLIMDAWFDDVTLTPTTPIVRTAA